MLNADGNIQPSHDLLKEKEAIFLEVADSQYAPENGVTEVA